MSTEDYQDARAEFIDKFGVDEDDTNWPESVQRAWDEFYSGLQMQPDSGNLEPEEK